MRRRTLTVLLLMVAFLVIGLYTKQMTQSMGFGDSDYYAKMAETPGQFVAFPWGYRIAVPYIAGFLSRMIGVQLSTAFGILQISMFAAILTVLTIWMAHEDLAMVTLWQASVPLSSPSPIPEFITFTMLSMLGLASTCSFCLVVLQSTMIILLCSALLGLYRVL